MNRRLMLPGALLLAAVIGVLAGRFLLNDRTVMKDVSAPSDILYWVAPMDPNYRRDEPGKSPMGMDLVPVYADQAGERDQSIVTIDPIVVNNLGVRTAPLSVAPSRAALKRWAT